MHSKKLIIYILFSVMMLANCKKDSADVKPENIDLAEFTGKWKVSPSLHQEILGIGAEQVVVESENGRQTLELSADGLGLRIVDQGNLVGYFLYSEKKETWKGLWKGSLVTLTLVQ